MCDPSPSRRRGTTPGGRERGFALAEAAVGFSLLATAALILASALFTSRAASAVARDRALALGAAQERMERLLAAAAGGPDDVLDANRETFDVPGLAPAGGGSAGLVVVDVRGYRLIDVTVSVRWRGALGDELLELKTTVLSREDNG